MFPVPSCTGLPSLTESSPALSSPNSQEAPHGHAAHGPILASPHRAGQLLSPLWALASLCFGQLATWVRGLSPDPSQVLLGSNRRWGRHPGKSRVGRGPCGQGQGGSGHSESTVGRLSASGGQGHCCTGHRQMGLWTGRDQSGRGRGWAWPWVGLDWQWAEPLVGGAIGGRGRRWAEPLVGGAVGGRGRRWAGPTGSAFPPAACRGRSWLTMARGHQLEPCCPLWTLSPWPFCLLRSLGGGAHSTATQPQLVPCSGMCPLAASDLPSGGHPPGRTDKQASCPPWVGAAATQGPPGLVRSQGLVDLGTLQ